MPLDTVQIGNLAVSRFIIGSNPFSGFSHQGVAQDTAMRHYFTTARIKETLREAERLGVNTLIARGDHHVTRLLCEYWDEGGALQWFAQTCPELGAIARGVQNAIHHGAVACHVHGGVMDNLYHQGNFDEAVEAIAMIRDAGLQAGIAGHRPEVFRWAEEHLDVDYYMCSYYDPIPRLASGEHIPGTDEQFLPAHRDAMAAVIAGLSKPAIHYKVMAAGRNDPREAFAYVARTLRRNDAVCVGIYQQHRPDMLAEDVALLCATMAGVC